MKLVSSWPQPPSNDIGQYWDDGTKIWKDLESYRETVRFAMISLNQVKQAVYEWYPTVEMKIEPTGIGFSCVVIHRDRSVTLLVSVGGELDAQVSSTLYFRPPGSEEYHFHRSYQHVGTAIRNMRRLLKVNA